MIRPLLVLLALCASACASTPPQTPARPSPLRIVSWNLEHLAERDGSGCRPRSEADYAALRAVADRIDADVIAFQEVESEAAALRVFDPAHYTVVIEHRTGSSGGPPCRGLEAQRLNRQAVGFAVRRNLEIRRHEDVTALQLLEPDLRSGVDIEVTRDGAPSLRLLTVHLKSGCASGDRSEACATLFRQIPILETWIDDRAREGAPFLVLGDFNRRLAASGDRVWADLDDSDPPGSDLFLVAGAAGAACDPRYPAFIDHIAASEAHRTMVSGFREWRFDGENLTDHCPISVEIGGSIGG